MHDIFMARKGNWSVIISTEYRYRSSPYLLVGIVGGDLYPPMIHIFGNVRSHFYNVLEWNNDKASLRNINCKHAELFYW